ncbi:MAG: sulfide/dihydroorotate dehydrogenase-like FAD/NAD-binding protein [Bacilli bacterium]|nr:sulfide/dihydroorotate dehydrogenase-like FAD/NAD-binding protein [Bacilli bacterium]
MYKVIKNEKINPNTYLMEIEAPEVIKNALPGQFVILMGKEDSERIPLTIYDTDKEKNILSVIYQVIGASTEELSTIKKDIFAVTGPLGKPNEICKNPEEYKKRKIVYVAGGVGVAPVYPQVKYLKERGFDIDVIYGAREKDLLIIQDKLEAVSKNVYYVTDDGSFGEKGFVTNVLEANHDKYDLCVAIGPLIMMKNVAAVTKKYNIQTIVSMNPLMVDGSGMCGACRCEIEGKPKFACIDGPEFDGHKVNYDLAMKRMNIYKEEEKQKWEQMKKELGTK